MIRALIYLFLLPLLACENLKEGLGMKKIVPDEFLIKKIDPIERPPNYDLLPPDSKNKIVKKNKNKNLKSLIDQNLKVNENLNDANRNENSSKEIEEEVLKEINIK